MLVSKQFLANFGDPFFYNQWSNAQESFFFVSFTVLYGFPQSVFLTAITGLVYYEMFDLNSSISSSLLAPFLS